MRVPIGLLLLLASGLPCVAQTKRALIIGINTYQPAGTTAEHGAGCAYQLVAEGRCALGRFPNLDGAVNDAQSIADLLTSPKFGFPTDKVFLLTNPGPSQPRTGVVVLPASQTSHDGILAAMQKYLVDLPQRGDTVVFYDASHGSLRINSLGTKMTVMVNGEFVHADSTLVPADAYKGGFDVRDREMTRIFHAALDKGVHLSVIFDSCHSGGATRGFDTKYRARTLAFDPRDVKEAPDSRPAPTERTDNSALVFSAAQQDQAAKEANPSAEQPEAHGAFTAALIEALQVLPADAPASLVYQRVRAVLEGNNVASQEPDLDATAARRKLPMFGDSSASGTDAKTMRAAVLRTERDGSVSLDIGRVSGIGVGSEFTSMVKDSKGNAIRLGVTDLHGIARSSAKIIGPPGAKVSAGEVFELSKWIPAESKPLRFAMWPSNLSENEILAAVAAIKASGVASVSEPAEEPWTDMLSWDGANWVLQHATPPTVAKTGVVAASAISLDVKADSPISLGAKLTASALKEHLSAGARVWVNLPPSSDLATKLKLNESDSSVASSDLADANYVLTGELSGTGPAYAWFHKQEFDAGPRTTVTTDHSPGCSTTSQYPVRSDWVSLPDAKVLDDGAKALNTFASRLAKIHGWLQLADSPIDGAAAKYYKLQMVRASDQTALTSDLPVQQDDRLQMALQAAAKVTERRWVYVLDIDCQGAGSLLYPLDYSENQFPSDADSGLQIILPGAKILHIGSPYGLDTLILLSTAQPLPDPYALEFEGVGKGASRGVESPLAKLLSDTSKGTRGPHPEVTTDWGLDLSTLRSVPK